MLKAKNVLSVGIACVFLYGVSMYIWRVFIANNIFIGDMGVTGLIATNMLEGEFPLYWWGQTYYAPFHALTIAPSIAIFGNTAAAFRFPEVILCTIFLTLFIRFIERYWSRSETFFALVLMVCPGFFVARYMGGAMFLRYIFALTFIELCFTEITSEQKNRIRLFAVGLLLGLSLWYTQTFLLYPMILLPVLFLESGTWKKIHNALACCSSRIPTVIWIVCSILAVLACFSMYKTSGALFGMMSRRYTLALFGLVIMLIVAIANRSYLRTAKNTCSFFVGYLIGNAPQWIGAYMYGIWPKEKVALNSKFELVNSLDGFFREFFPAFVGFNLVPSEVRHLRSAIICSLGALVLYSVWKNRESIIRFVQGVPIDRRNSVFLVVLGIFAIPMIIAIGMSLRAAGGVRMILDAYPAYAILIGIALTSLTKRYGKLGWLFSLLFVATVAVSTQLMIYRMWPPKLSIYTPHHLAGVERIMNNYAVTGGYAQWGIVYPFNFLTSERIILAPEQWAYSRRPEYRHYVDAQKRFAYIGTQKNTKVHKNLYSPQSLVDAMYRKKKPPKGGAYKNTADRIARSTLLHRSSVKNLDVWIFEDPTYP